MFPGAKRGRAPGRSGRRSEDICVAEADQDSTEGGQELRDTGLPPIGRVPWGSHFCIFYETKQDLLDILVPYFRAGVERNELCVCYGGSYEFHTIPEAKRRLSKKLPELDDLLECGKGRNTCTQGLVRSCR